MQKTLIKNSFIYSFSSFIQKGLLFLLLPVYTQYLQPNDYGVITVVLATSYLWSTFFSLGLDNAIIRFYYDKETSGANFKSLFGTLLLFIFGISIVNYVLLVTVFSFVIDFLLSGKIPFYPYVYIGLAILIFQPVYNFSLAFLQIKKDVGKYTVLSFFYFFINISLTVLLVIVWEMSSFGYLVAILISQAVSCAFGLILIRNEYEISFRWHYVKKSLGYSYLFIPHNLMSQIAIDSDRFILNKYLSTASAGLYHLGYVLSVPIEVITHSVNRAFSPMLLQNIEGGEQDRKKIVDSSLSIIFIYYLATVGLSFFSYEIVFLFFDEKFIESSVVIPFIAFGFLNAGFYYLFSAILFYDKTLTKYMPACTVISGIAGVGLDFLLIPFIGLKGAAIAFVVGRFILAGVALHFSRKNRILEWPLNKFTVGYILCLVLVFLAVWATEYVKFSILFMIGKFVLLVFLPFALSLIFWGKVNFFFKPIMALVKSPDKKQ